MVVVVFVFHRSYVECRSKRSSDQRPRAGKFCDSCALRSALPTKCCPTTRQFAPPSSDVASCCLPLVVRKPGAFCHGFPWTCDRGLVFSSCPRRPLLFFFLMSSFVLISPSPLAFFDACRQSADPLYGTLLGGWCLVVVKLEHGQQRGPRRWSHGCRCSSPCPSCCARPVDSCSRYVTFFFFMRRQFFMRCASVSPLGKRTPLPAILSRAQPTRG